MPPIAATSPEIDPAADLEAQVEEAVALCGGDVRAALRSALVANAFLEAQVDCLSAATSAGYVRRRIRSPQKNGGEKAGEGDEPQDPGGLSQPEAAPGAGGK